MANKERGIDNLKDNERAIRGALMSTMVYKENIHRIGAEEFIYDDEDKKIMQRTFNNVFTPVKFPDGILINGFDSQLFAHKGYLPDTPLVNTEFTYNNGVYSPGKKGSFGAMAGALITTSDDPENPGKKILNVAFRGTDVDEKAGMKSFVTKAYPDMEKYYHDNFIPLEYMIKEYIKDPSNNISSVEASGHSLGGAMVHRFLDSLESDWLVKIRNKGVTFKGVTFGSPGYLSRVNESVAPHVGEIKVLKVCAIEDYREVESGELKKTVRMTASALRNMMNLNELDTRMILFAGDIKATQKYSHLDVKQFAHDYDPVTNYGYLEKQRVGKVERLTDFYKENDYKKVENWATSVIYYRVTTGKEYGNKLKILTEDLNFKIPQTDYKYINYVIDVANDVGNKGLDFTKYVATNIAESTGKLVGLGKAIWKGEEGKKYAAIQVEKLASFNSHSSNRYIKNLNIKIENDNNYYQITEEEKQKYGPVQVMYNQQKEYVMAEQKSKEDKLTQFISVASLNETKLNNFQSSQTVDFESFLEKAENLSEKYSQSMEKEESSYIPSPLKRM